MNLSDESWDLSDASRSRGHRAMSSLQRHADVIPGTGGELPRLMSIFPITKSAANKMHDPGFRSVEKLKDPDLKELKTWLCLEDLDFSG